MQTRIGKSMGAAILVVALLALGAASFAVYKRQVGQLTMATADQAQLFESLTGVNNPEARNSLNARYTDADGDLVADAPTDPAKQQNPAVLKFSYVAVEDDTEFRGAFTELLAAISRATGKPTEYVTYGSFDDELRALRDGQLQIAGLNTGSVPIGVCTAGFVPVSQLGNADGSAGYHLKIIARADASVSKLADIRGHELTLTEPSSNSGYKAPLVLMRENGLRPPLDYLIRYSQGHQQSIEGIKSKQFEIAAVADDVLKREENDGKIAPADYKVIYTSDQLFPGACLGYGNALKPELAAKIKDVLTTFSWKGTGLEKTFAAEGKAKFVPVNYTKDWGYVRRIDDSIGFKYALSSAPATTEPSTQPTASIGDHGRAIVRAVANATMDVTPAPDVAVAELERWLARSDIEMAHLRAIR